MSRIDMCIEGWYSEGVLTIPDQRIIDLFIQWMPTGSVYIVPGMSPSRSSDIDFICLCGRIDHTINRLVALGFEPFGSDPGREFVSFRKGKVNLIVTENPVFYGKFCLATKLAKRFRLVSKDDRIALFRAILYNEFPVTSRLTKESK